MLFIMSFDCDMNVFDIMLPYAHLCKNVKKVTLFVQSSVSIFTEEFLPISLKICQKQTYRNIYTTHPEVIWKKNLVEALKNNLW